MSPQSIAHYRITAKLGEGGMGEVYRATDTKLGRDVAIKILPESFAHDRDRMARFAREAQVLASLNHPNIAAIYGVEDRALIMELVEGPTLAERIAQGPMRLAEALPIARQMAEALEYAHERGVVHRDLKPANVKVTPEGRVKVLDFGLASVAQASANDTPITASSPTLTMQATLGGMILGTAGYMSPEQARGHAVDKRADIWAFGVVLYEMLTGQPLFEGRTISDTLAAVLTKEPEWDRVPASVQRLLRLCLAKDAKDRLREIGDARFLVEDPGSQVAPATTVPSRVLPWSLAGIFVLIATVLGIGLWRATRPVERPLLSLSVDLGPDAVAGRENTVALSPDGARVVYPVRMADGKQFLAIRLLSQPNASTLSETEGAFNPFFSPDGQWVGYFTVGKLKKISVQGGASVALCDARAGKGASWGDDGYIVATLDSGLGLSRIPEAGGTPQPLTQPGDTGEATHRYPQVLPGSNAVLYTSHASFGDFDGANIAVLSLKNGQRKTILRGGYFGRYIPSGHLVYVHKGTLFGAPFDPTRLEVTGAPAPIVEGIAARVDYGSGHVDFSRNGTLVYLSGKAAAPEAWPVLWIDSSGKPQPLIAKPGVYLNPRLSPDGKRLAVAVGVSGPASTDIWVYDIEREAFTKLTFADVNHGPVWSPDGKYIAYQSQFKGGVAIALIRADGAGEPRRLWETKNFVAPSSFSPDGRRLAFFEMTPETGSDIWILPLDMSEPGHPKPGKPEVFLRTSASEAAPAFSPDGRWMAYSSNESGTTEIYVRPIVGGSSGTPSAPGAGKWLVSTGGGRNPFWSPAGRQLVYGAPDGRVIVADYTVEGNSFRPGKPRPWTDKPIVNPTVVNVLSLGGGYTLAPDGKRLVVLPNPVSTGEAKGNLHVMMLVNFFDELRRRVPPGSK